MSKLTKNIKLWITPLSIAYTLIILAAYHIPHIWPFELLISFLPYILVMNMVFFCILFFFFKRSQTKISLFFLSIITISLFLPFYDYSFQKVPETKREKTITVAFLNKLYSNTNYQEIDAVIEQIKPDILGLAEVKEHELEQLATLKSYPYSYSQKKDRSFSVVLLSKYPLIQNERLLNISQGITATATIDGKTVTIITLHILPPLLPSYYTNRNTDLETLSRYVTTQKTDSYIIMGDFNTSPWSPHYRSFLKKTPMLRPVEKGYGMFLTWGYIGIRSHIDHFFISDAIAVQSFQTKPIQGSDHDFLWTTLQL